ncbi:MAG: sigma-70 family RNA polymerase sigma factor [Candidatus Pacebacteria bacterium]|nr:sigma-70 family RNA polymerase sigma factor [Candidatus Paceibacterota bacterium]
MARNEKKLIGQYLKGDEKSLEVLISQYLKPIYSFVYRYVGNAFDAEDITQEVFVRMWQNIKKFDQKRNFQSWIFGIAKNAAIDFLRKKKALPFSVFEDKKGNNVFLETLASQSPLPDALWEKDDLASKIASAIKKLSFKYQKVLSLYYYENLTFKKIAVLSGEPLNTIKSQHRRALINLRKALDEL